MAEGPLVENKRPPVREILSSTEIQQRVGELGREITRDYQGKSPLLVLIMDGALLFGGDLIQAIDHEQVGHDYATLDVSSYGSGTSSSRRPKINQEQLNGLDIADRDVIIVEDIVDTGHTLTAVRQTLGQGRPASLATCALLSKPERREIEVPIEYLGFEIPNVWLEGYGLDTNGRFRCSPNIMGRIE